MTRSFLFRSLVPVACVPAALALAVPAAAQGSPYTLRVPQIDAAPGQVVTVPVLFDNAGGNVQGWSFGLAVPPELVVQSFGPGTTTMTVNGGGPPDYEQDTIYPGVGVTTGVIVDFVGQHWLPPGSDYELHLLQIQVPADAYGGAFWPLTFDTTIGVPPVDVIVVENSQGHTPNQMAGAIRVPVGTSYCSGDGSATPCPCGNVGDPGAGCANSSGVGGLLEADGTNRASADDLVFRATSLLPNQPALLFAGLNAVNGGAGSSFGDGLRCAGGGVVRLGVRIPDVSGSATWGPGLVGAGGFQAGDVRRFQGWYRDPGGPCGTGFSLTQGYEIHFVP